MVVKNKGENHAQRTKLANLRWLSVELVTEKARAC